MRDVFFKSVRLIDPASGYDAQADLLVSAGKIADFGPNLSCPDGAEIIKGEGAVLCPGLVDMRVTVGEPGFEYRETIASASKAAVAGGITTVAVLPNTRPVIDDPALVRFMAARGEETGLCSWLPYGALTKGCRGEEPAELGLMKEAGAVGFTDGTKAVGSAKLMASLLTYAKDFDRPVIVHPEEPTLAGNGVATSSELSTRLGLPSVPAVAEVIMVERDIRLCRMTGAPVHFAHISTKDALEAVRAAKKSGLPVTCDTAPPYFDLNELSVGNFRTYAKLSPPLRSEEDRQAVVAALADGTVDAIASDHQPGDPEDKRLPFAEAAPGGTGLATLLSITLSKYHDKTLNLIQLLGLLTSAPAKILRTEAGRIVKNHQADLCLFSLHQNMVIETGKLPGKAQNTPFDGRVTEGKVIGTWKAGKRVF